MHLEHFIFATRHLNRADRAEVAISVLQLVEESLRRDGKIGNTGWAVSFPAREFPIDAWVFSLRLHDAPITKAFLAGADAVSNMVWLQACCEAANLGQLRVGTSRRRLKAPWLGVVLPMGALTGSRSSIVEAGALEAYVAFALLGGTSFEGCVQ